MDSVNNRSLFRKRSQAARDKVREMGRVPHDRPGGILASFTDLMEVANRDRARNLMPSTFQQMQPMQRMPMQGPMMAQPQPVRMQMGGDVALEAYRQGMPEPTLGQQFQAMQQNSMPSMQNNPQPPAMGVDIGATPTPRAPVEVPDIGTMVRQRLSDNPEALARYNQLEEAITNPDVPAEQVQAEVTDAAGMENTTDNFRSIVQQITGREQPSSATVDELNDAIAGVALGGAIGGPRSVAERISNGMLVGLQAKRETALAREAFENELAVAQAGAQSDPLSELYGSGTSDLETKHFGNVPQFMPTLPGTLAGASPIIAGEQDRLIMTYNNLMDESDRLLGLSAEAENLLETGDVAGFEGSASRFMSRAAAALPGPVAAVLGVDRDNPQASAAQRFDVIQRTLAAQLAPMLLGESGRTISDGDRRRVAELMGIAFEDKDGTGLNITGLSAGAFKSEAEMREAINEVRNILLRNRQEIESEFEMLAGRIPGFSVQRPSAPETAATPTSANAPIVLTEEDILRYGE